MSTCVSSMALFYRITAASSRVDHVTLEETQPTGWGCHPAQEERRLETEDGLVR